MPDGIPDAPTTKSALRGAAKTAARSEPQRRPRFRFHRNRLRNRAALIRHARRRDRNFDADSNCE